MSQPALRNDEPFPVSVEFLSDWACGTGTVRYGVVDREVQRDHEGYPLLRGKAMAAMLRDAAETVAAGLDEGSSGRWHRWIEVIFGSQRPLDHIGQGPADRAAPVAAALRPRPLRIPERVRAAVAAYGPDTARLAREALVLVRPGVAIDDVTGAARDQMLRMEERAAAGLTLTARWWLRFDDLAAGAPVPWEAELLLLAAARMVDRVGGRRRRGAGRCRVMIGKPPIAGPDRLSTLLDQVALARPPDEALPAHRPVNPAALPASRLGGRRHQPLRHRYDLRLTALTPLLIARGVAGNAVLTERYVPGASLLPWIARALGPDATALITGGQVVVTHATIEIDGGRSLPMPRALHAPKDHPTADTLVNVLRAPVGQRLKPAGGFCVPVGGGLLRGEPQLVAHTHAVVDDEPQRPNERTGGLFTYQAIEAGTVLRAEVWLADGVPLDPSSLAGERAVGRSSKDDYGQVRVEVRDPAPQRVTGPAAGSDELVVWLLSDLLLRGSAGEPAADVASLATTLGEALGVRLTAPDPLSASPAAVLGASRAESWQARWGLPRPSLTGLAGGSVVRFELAGVPDPAAYERVVAAGLGERTAEGFGRIALQPPLLAAAEVAVRSPEPPAAASPAAPRPSADPPSEAAARAYAVRGWRRELYRQAVARARDDTVRERLVPAGASAAQLGTLRTIAEQLHTAADPAPARGWLKQTSAIRHRREAWLQQRPDRLQTLERLFQGVNDELWELLAIQPPAGLAEQLYWPALAWLLAEAARTQSNRQPGEET